MLIVNSTRKVNIMNQANPDENEASRVPSAADRARAEYENLKATRFDILYPTPFREQVDRAVLSAHAWLESLEARIDQVEHALRQVDIEI